MDSSDRLIGRAHQRLDGRQAMSARTAALLFGAFALLAWVPLPFVGDFNGVIDHRHNLVLPAAAADSVVEHGQFPFWNPYAKGGFSLIGAMEDGTLFPTFPLALVFGVFVAAILDYLLFTAAGALGLLLLARRLGASPGAAMLPALAFVFSNTMPVYLVGGWGMHLTMALIPLGIWLYLGDGGPLFNRGVRHPPEPRLGRYDIGLAVLFALFFLRGGTYPLAYLAVIIGILAARDAVRGRTARPLARFGAIGVVALLLAAVKVIPAFTSGDLGMPRGQEGYCFTLEGLVVGLNTWVLNGSLFEGCGAVGPVVFGLGVLGFAVRRRELGGLMLCTVCLLVYALGSNLSPARWFGRSNQMHICAAGPSIHDLLEHLPVVGALWNPSRALVPAGMLLSVAAALGLDRVVSGLGRRHVRTAVVVVVCLAAAVPAFYEARAYLYRHMTPLETPRAAAASEPFRQAEVCPTNDAFCPLLKRGSARGPILPFHTPASDLRVMTDASYLGEEYWLADGGKATLAEWSPNRLRYTLEGAGEGRLVVNQNFRAGWHAEGGGAVGEAQSYRGLLSVAARAPGEVVLTYRPVTFFIGLAVSVLTILVLLGLRWRRSFTVE